MKGVSATPEPAPGDLEIVQALVNTRRLRPEAEDLKSPKALAAWLAERRLVAAGTEVGPADLQRVRQLRETVRGLLRANAGAELSDGFVAAFDKRVAAASIHMRFRPSGRFDFEASDEGVDGFVDGLYLVIALAQRDGTWRRLKACARKDCRQAFYDASRNLSRVWCTPRCGNELAKRASRARLRTSW